MSKTMQNQALKDQLRSFAGDAGSHTSTRGGTSELTEEAIRERAYKRYLERGGTDGYAEGDWYEAERELKASGRD